MFPCNYGLAHAYRKRSSICLKEEKVKVGACEGGHGQG